MFETAVDPTFIYHLRGRFKRNVVEWVFPSCILGAVLGVPIGVYLSPTPAGQPPLIILVLVYGLLPAVAACGVYMLTTSFEFDGQFITCRRMGSLVAWRHEVASVEAVEIGSEVMTAVAATLNYYYVRWPDSRHAVYLTSDMRSQMTAYLTNL